MLTPSYGFCWIPLTKAGSGRDAASRTRMLSLAGGVREVPVIVTGDAVNGNLAAARTFMDEHQLALERPAVFLRCVFEGEPDGRHFGAAFRQAVTGGFQVNVARVQAPRAVVAIVHPAGFPAGGYISLALDATEFPFARVMHPQRMLAWMGLRLCSSDIQFFK